MSKEALLQLCVAFVNKKSTIIETIMTENRKALEQESKSSAGDKHETGRAMVQLEMEKASQQLEVVKQMKETLDKIQLHSISTKIKLGNLIRTDHGNYFLSISAGELNLDGTSYYAVSPSSPIGALLLGKEEGAKISFGPKNIQILSVE